MNPFLIRQSVDLQRENLPMRYAQPLQSGNKNAHRWQVTVLDGGAKADLAGVSGTLWLTHKQDGSDLSAIAPVTVSGNTAQVLFPAACYAVPGEAIAVMELSKGEIILGAAVLTLRVVETRAGTVIDEAKLVPDISALLAEIANMRAATASANAAAAEARTAAQVIHESESERTFGILRNAFDGSSRLPTSLFINATVTLTETSANYGKVATDVTYMVVTNEIQCLPFAVTLAVTDHPFCLAVFRYAEDGTFLGSDGYTRLEQRIAAGEHFRVAVYRSDVTSGTADIAEYVSELQVLRVNDAPNTVVTDGAINAMLGIAEDYFKWAYKADSSSPLLYGGADVDNSLWYTGMSPTLSGDGIEQYTINCSGFVNILLLGVPLSESRYIKGADAVNGRRNWGYVYDKTVRLGDYWSYQFYGTPVLNNNLGDVFTYDMLRYAEGHGFAYTINEDLSNVRPGDVLYESDYADHTNRYRGIVHCVLCLGVDKVNRLLVVVESTGATWTNYNTKETHDVGIRFAVLAIGNFKYGARFPVGDVSGRAELVKHWTGASAGAVALGNVARGIYTCIVKGNFTMRPQFSWTFDSGTRDYVSMLQVDDNTFAVTRYIPVDAPLSINPNKDDTSFLVESVDVYHGYASPYADYSEQKKLYAVQKALEQLGVQM